jgi:phage shock protein A
MRQLLAWLFDVLADLQRQASSPMASLERSIAAARRAHTSARRTLAVAMAEEARETERRTNLAAKAGDLEERALEALCAGREDLATQAAEAIASMATDINASEQAALRFAAEVALARREVDAQRRRLSDLDRGRRLARIGNAMTATTDISASGRLRRRRECSCFRRSGAASRRRRAANLASHRIHIQSSIKESPCRRI